MTKPGTALAIPASPTLAMSYDETRQWAETLSKTDLVRKDYQGKPDAIMLVGAMGAKMGLDLVTALQVVDVIDNQPVPNAQTKLGQIRVHGHEAQFIVHERERAVLRARRGEYRGDETKWVTIERTIDDAREAGMLDEWVEHWVEGKRKDGSKYSFKERLLVRREVDHYVNGEFGATVLPDWAQQEIDYGKVKRNDVWWRRLGNMLRAWCARDMHRMEFSDLLFSEFVAPLANLVEGQEDRVDDRPMDDDEIVEGEIVEPSPTAAADGKVSVRGSAENTGGGGVPENEGDDHLVVESPSSPKGPASADPPTSAEQWRVLLKQHGKTQGDLLRKAMELAVERGLPAPSGLADIDDAGLAGALAQWLTEGATT